MIHKYDPENINMINNPPSERGMKNIDKFNIELLSVAALSLTAVLIIEVLKE